MTYEPDAWDQIDAQSSGIVGQHLKCAKGLWTLDKEEIEIGNAGIKVAVPMDTATIGEVLWEDHEIVDRHIGRIADGFIPNFKCPEGWNPYTSFLCVRMDAGSEGQILTFSSTSWGGRKALNSLISQFRLMRKSRYRFGSSIYARAWTKSRESRLS